MIDQLIKAHRSNNKRLFMMKHHYEKRKKEVQALIFNKFFYVAKTEEEHFKLNSGTSSRFYFDTRHLMLNWKYNNRIGDLFRYLILFDIYEDNTDLTDLVIGGLETGAILLTMSTIQKISVDGFYVRKEIKQHGNQKRIVTPVDLNEKRVIIIDDIVSSGASIDICMNSLKIYYPRCDIWKVYCLIDRSNELNFDPFKNWSENDVDFTGFYSVFDSEEDFINLLNTKKA